MTIVYIPQVIKKSHHAELGCELADMTRPGDLNEIGARWTRITLNWSKVETERGVYDWYPEFERVYQYCVWEGIKMIVSIHDTPVFYRSNVNRSIYPPALQDVGAFQRFVREAVRKYIAVDVWECWNEPEMVGGFDGYCGGDWEPLLYQTFLNAFYGAVKSIDRSAAVMWGGLMMEPYSLDWFRKASKPAGKYYDLLGLHVYCDIRRGDGAEKTTRTLALDMLNGLMELSGAPVWITETNLISAGDEPQGVEFENRKADWIDVVSSWPEFQVVIVYANQSNWRNANLFLGSSILPAGIKFRELSR